MKKNLLYLVLIAYSITVLKPLSPSIVDVLAHKFWYSQHMATVHYEKGKYHVHLEKKEAAESNTSEKNNHLLTENDFFNVHLSTIAQYNFNLKFFDKIYYPGLTSRLSFYFPGNDYPPPKS